MKKITGLFFVFAFFTSVLCAKSIEVTTSEMDVTIAGSLPYVIENAESGSIIEFNFDGEELDYGEGTGIIIKGKNLTINGINKKTGNVCLLKGYNPCLRSVNRQNFL